MKFFTDIPGAFREGIINASTTPKIILRWAVVSILGLLAIACVALGVVAIATGFIVPGVTILINSITFTFVTITSIYTFSTSESLARIRALR